MEDKTKIKDPDSVLDYAFDWTEWLGTDNISTSSWTVPLGLAEVTNTKTAKTATVWLSGGTAGSRYIITNQITTAAGRIENQSMVILCGEK
jgi:hypothetical protein